MILLEINNHDLYSILIYLGIILLIIFLGKTKTQQKNKKFRKFIAILRISLLTIIGICTEIYLEICREIDKEILEEIEYGIVGHYQFNTEESKYDSTDLKSYGDVILTVKSDHTFFLSSPIPFLKASGGSWKIVDHNTVLTLDTNVKAHREAIDIPDAHKETQYDDLSMEGQDLIDTTIGNQLVFTKIEAINRNDSILLKNSKDRIWQLIAGRRYIEGDFSR